MIPKGPQRARGCAALIALSLAGGAGAPTLALAEEDCLGPTVEATRGEATDARSLRLADGRVARLTGIEPFGLLLPNGEEAEAALQQRLTDLIAGTALKVRALSEEPDRYGRHPALVEADGRLVQETVVREGLAIAFAGGDALPCFERILAAEAAARRARRGFWAEDTLPQAWPGELASRIGRFAIFEGRVVSVGKRRARTYLNFGENWAKDTTAEIAAEDREKFGGEAALETLSGRRVRLRGFLEEKGGPMLVLRSPMQLEMLDAVAEKGGIAP